jgi:hypothetical protein
MIRPDQARVSRREFLQTSGAFAASAMALPGSSLLHGSFGPRTEHVVLIAFAGGVRSKEVLDTPANVPNLMRIASAGVTMPDVRCENTGHYGAALSIFTGNVEALGIRENERGLSPTLFEYLRKDAGLGAGDVWLSTASGAQGRLFAYSDHPGYGVDFAANVLDGDGIFNVEFKKVLDSFGQPRADSDHDRDVLARLQRSLDPEALAGATGKAPDPDNLRRMEGFILEELTGATSRITGPGAGDAKAIRVGLDILRVFRPRVVGITLQNADIAHGSFNGYVEVIRRNDAEIGKLWDAIQQDQALRDRTAVLVLPEFGRDQDLNERNGLDHGDRSDSMLKVFLIAAGPDFKRNKVVRKEVRTIDVCPTVYSLFAKGTPGKTSGKVIRELFA